MAFLDPSVLTAIEQVKRKQDEPLTLTLRSRKHRTWEGELPFSDADVNALEECFAKNKIRHLRVSYRNMANLTGWRFLKQAHHLESITLHSDLSHGDEITETQMVAFVDAMGAWATPSMKKVILESFGMTLGESFVAALQRMVHSKPFLEHLELYFWGFRDHEVAASFGRLFVEENVSRLKTLKLNIGQLGDKGIGYILKGVSRGSEQLQEFQLVSNANLSHERILDLILFLETSGKTLKILNLQECSFFASIDDQCLEAFLGALSRCSALESLSLNQCRLSGRTVYRLLRSNLPQSLVKLDLEYNDISDRAMAVILRHAVPYLKSLRELILRPKGKFRSEAVLPFYWEALHRNTCLYKLHVMHLREYEEIIQESYRLRNVRLVQTQKLLSYHSSIPLALLSAACSRLARDENGSGLCGLRLLVSELAETVPSVPLH